MVKKGMPFQTLTAITDHSASVGSPSQAMPFFVDDAPPYS